MKELDGLRKALVERTPGEWRGDRYDGTVKYGIRGPLGGYILCHDPETGLLAIEEPDAHAIVLSVNLAPHLLRVAEAAEATQAIVDIIIWDEQARCRNCGCDRPDHNINCDIPDLPAALAALKEAAGGGE